MTPARSVMALVLGAALRMDAAGAHGESPDSPITVTLEVEQDQYPVRAPVRLYATFENRSQKGGAAAEAITPSPVCGFLRLRGRGPHGEFALEYFDETRPATVDGVTMHAELRCDQARLRPGDRWTIQVITAYDPVRGVFLLPDPGIYSFVAEYRAGSIQADSPAVTLVATAPSETEKSAMEAFSRDIALVAQVPRWASLDVTSELVSEVSLFAEEHVGSVYGGGLLPGLRLTLDSMGARQAPEARARLMRMQERLADPGARGPERQAHDALTPDSQLILLFGNQDAGERAGAALGVSTQAILDAARFVRHHGGTAVALALDGHLRSLLRAKERLGTIKPEERALLDGMEMR